MNQTISKRSLSTRLIAVLIALLMCLALLPAQTKAAATTIKITMDWPVAGKELPNIVIPGGTSKKDSGSYWSATGSSYAFTDVPTLSQVLDASFSMSWYPSISNHTYTADQIKNFDYEVTFKSDPNYDVEKTFKVDHSQVTVSGNDASFKITGLRPLVVMNEGDTEYTRDFTFKYPSDLKFKEGDTPDFGIAPKFAGVYDLAGPIVYHPSGDSYTNVSSNMTGGETYELVLTTKLADNAVIDWTSPYAAFNTPNYEYYETAFNKSNRTVTFTIKDIACVRTIDEIAVKGLTAPAIGDKPSTDGITLSTADSNPKNPVGVSATTCSWSGNLDKYGNFLPDQHYTLSIGYQFDYSGLLYEAPAITKNNVTVNAGTVESISHDADKGTILIGFDTSKENFAITFDANGGTGTMDVVTVENGQAYTLPENPFTAPAGKEFDAWDQGVPGSSITITEDTVIKALWKDKAGKTAKVGTTLTDTSSQGTYKVTKAGTSGKAEVQYKKPTNKASAKVTIPATITVGGFKYKVTSVASNAFKNNKKIKSVVIGKNVTAIGNNAFYGCTKLSSVTIGAKVQTIGNQAFAKCTALKKIVLPAKITKIGKQAFNGDKKLSTIQIKTTKLTAKKIGAKAFTGIAKKATFKLPKAKLKAYKSILLKKGATKKMKFTK